VIYKGFYENHPIMETLLSSKISISVMKALLHSLHP